jgi:hypothetical protein
MGVDVQLHALQIFMKICRKNLDVNKIRQNTGQFMGKINTFILLPAIMCEVER